MRNITIITGTRAEFGIWTPILRALQHSKKLHLHLLVTGMHLQKQFGHTIDDIRQQKFPIAATVPMYLPKDTPAQSLARGTAAMAAAFQKLKPDLVMVLGDRLEILAAANAALASQIPLAHLHGGESAPGQWDEQIRHAITKIAHLHFPATKLAAQRIQQMGEPKNTIHPIGAPALDTVKQFLTSRRPPPQAARANVPPPLGHALLLLHPSSPSDTLEKSRTALLLAALNASKIPFSIVGPNNDPGHKGILAAYAKAKKPIDMSMSQHDFWTHLYGSSFLIGNSSSGILEAASLGIPVINLGDRQKNRERNPNVLDVPWPTNPKPIERAIHHALTNQPFRKKIARRQNLYGNGTAAPRLLKILESLKFPLPTTKSFGGAPLR